MYKINDNYIQEIKDNELEGKKELISFLSRQHYQDLELVATIYYLINKGFKGKALINKLKILKPHLADRIDNAFEIYKQINSMKN